MIKILLSSYLTCTLSFCPSAVISLFNHFTSLTSLSLYALLLLLLPLTVCRCHSLLSIIPSVFLPPPPSTLLPLSLQLSNPFLFLFHPSHLLLLPLCHPVWHCSFAHLLLIFIFSLATFTKLSLLSLFLSLFVSPFVQSVGR